MIIFVLLALLLGPLCIGLYWYARIHYLIHCSCGKIPAMPGGWPILGHLVEFGLDAFKFVTDSARTTEALGGITKVWFGLRPIFMVTDPKIAQTLMNACLQKSHRYQLAAPWLGQSLFIAKLPHWKHTRKLINPTFNQQVLDSFLVVFNEQGRRLVDVFDQKAGKGEFEHYHLIARNIMETTCLTMMGLSEDQRSIVDRKYIRSVDRTIQIIIKRARILWLQPDWLYEWTGLKTEETKLVQFIKGESRKLLKARKAALSAESINSNKDRNTRFKTFLELLLELKDHFSDEEIIDEVSSMIVASYDTSATTLMIYMIVLGSYPVIQAKIYEELRQVIGYADRDVTKADLGKLVYLEATLKEVMRFYPIGPIVMRAVLENVKLENYTVPTGSEVAMNIWGLHRSTAWWGADADVFRPERWLDLSTSPNCTVAFGGFGVGRRSCIGKNYAMMNMKTTLVHFLRNFSIKGDMSKLAFKFELLLKPVSRQFISVESRCR